PSQESVADALNDLGTIIRPPRRKGPGHIDPNHDPWMGSRLQGMRALYSLYADSKSVTYNKWGASSLQAAVTLGHGTYCARILRRLCRQYIDDCSVLPENPYGDWKKSMLVNEDLSQELNLHLQECHSSSSGVNATTVRDFLCRPGIMSKYAITKEVLIQTARRYLKVMGYRFMKTPSGQYVNGHERKDVKEHRDRVYIPKLQELRR
ncbi:hypothetical protein CYLTODRAFT_322378, partial [Cylindrobasidium torrendii FP15055 ss-10]